MSDLAFLIAVSHGKISQNTPTIRTSSHLISHPVLYCAFRMLSSLVFVAGSPSRAGSFTGAVGKETAVGFGPNNAFNVMPIFAKNPNLKPLLYLSHSVGSCVVCMSQKIDILSRLIASTGTFADCAIK